MLYQIIAPFVMALIIFGLSATVYLRNKRSRINISYGLFVAFVALWSLGVSLFYYSTTQGGSLFWADGLVE